MSDDNHYQSALLEEMRDEIRAIHEGQAPLMPISRNVVRLKEDMTEVKTRLTNVEAAVTDISNQHCQIDKRVTTLEEAAP